MVTYEGDNRAAPEDSRKIVINGQAYHCKTDQKCKVCDAGHESYMYVLKKYDGECTLECPRCGTFTYAKLVMVREAK